MISVAVDWGSSSFRAYRFDAAGLLIDSTSSASGIKFVAENGFEAVLREQVDHWLSPGDKILLSGMITSRNGWLESDYIPCPADLGSLIDHARRLPLSDIELIFLPGLNQWDPPDVMRGEELQLLGAAAGDGVEMFIIPGTHSKWALVNDGAVRKFRTIPTGELFDLIINHSLMGALTIRNHEHESVFRTGVERGYQSATVISDLFTTRSSVLMEQRSGDQSYAWLSGLLIGNEIREGLSLMPPGRSQIKLIGSMSLCKKYLTAFDSLGIEVAITDDDVTVQGFQQIIQSL